SVREAVGHKVKINLRHRVQVEVKGDKVENKILALTSYRAFLDGSSPSGGTVLQFPRSTGNQQHETHT
uniref:CARMIL pleckstrin homology domain-containing protein n=1 Tax=Cynoglossus semilaevis TaxID=244447 RepID=A0A3P8WPC0_CYNSE